MSVNETNASKAPGTEKVHKEFKGDPRTLEAFKKMLKENYDLMFMHLTVDHEKLASLDKRYSLGQKYQPNRVDSIWDKPSVGASPMEIIDIFHLLRHTATVGRNQLPADLVIPFAQKLMASSVNNTQAPYLLKDFREEAMDFLFMKRFADNPDRLEPLRPFDHPAKYISKMLGYINLDLPVVIERITANYQSNYSLDFEGFFQILGDTLQVLNEKPTGAEALIDELVVLAEDHRNRCMYVAKHSFNNPPGAELEFKSSKDVMKYIIDELGTA